MKNREVTCTFRCVSNFFPTHLHCKFVSVGSLTYLRWPSSVFSRSLFPSISDEELQRTLFQQILATQMINNKYCWLNVFIIHCHVLFSFLCCADIVKQTTLTSRLLKSFLFFLITKQNNHRKRLLVSVAVFFLSSNGLYKTCFFVIKQFYNHLGCFTVLT